MWKFPIKPWFLMGGKQLEIPGSWRNLQDGIFEDRNFFFQIPFLSPPIYVLIGKSSIF